jgi:hypothetical protein
LAIVYALDMFRVYIFSYEVYLRTKNTAFYVLGKYAIISNRIAGWVMQIQEYNLHTQHVKGSDSFWQTQ